MYIFLHIQDGILHGTGVIIHHTGTHGVHSHGIIIMVIIITGITYIMVTIVSGILTVIRRWNDYYYRNTRAYSPAVSHRIQTGVYKTTYSHPEERREGEAMFAKSHPEQIRRSSGSNSSTEQKIDDCYNRSTNSNERNLNNNTTRRSTESVPNRSLILQTDRPILHQQTDRLILLLPTDRLILLLPTDR